MRGNETDLAGLEHSSSSLDILGELSARMKRLENQVADIKAMVNEAREKGDVGFDYEHASHVLDKFFPHDKPAPVSAEPPKPMFDSFTGKPLQ
jgi:hypothetical protein